MSEEEKAISFFEKQKQQIDNFPNSNDAFWVNDTLDLIEKFIGKDSKQYGLLSSHTFYPNLNAENPETEESQRERGRQMIDSCINFIKAQGVKKEPLTQPTNNYHFPNSHNPIVGNIIQGSLVNNPINLETHTTNNENAKTPSKRSWIEPVYWIAGILLACAMLYEFVIKHINWH